jgi:hypothetical protein
LSNDYNFEIILKYLKYPARGELNIPFYPVWTLYEIKTNYKKEELIDAFDKNGHDSEIKELRSYNKDNYKEIYSYKNKTEYLDELFIKLFE